MSKHDKVYKGKFPRISPVSKIICLLLSSVFFRPGSLEMLESERLRIYSTKATIIQRQVRSSLVKQRYGTLKASCVTIQSEWRRHFYQKIYMQKRKAACVVQSWRRFVLANTKTKQLRLDKAATKIQSR